LANTIGDSLALAAGSISLAFVARMRRTYFLDSKFFIGVANIAFNIILVDYLLSDIEIIPPSQLIFTVMIATAALSIGFASYMLKAGQGESGLSELKAFLSRPPRPFLIFESTILLWALIGVALEPWTLDPSLASQGIFHYSYQLWYLTISAIVAVVFICLPVLGVYRHSRNLSDSKASKALKTISFSWAGFGIASFFQVAFAPAQTAGVVADGLLFLGIAFALREPTILSRVISSLPAKGNLDSSKATNTVVLYKRDSDRRNLAESFARGELRAGRKATFLVGKSEIPFYKAIVRELMAQLSSQTPGSILIQPIEETLDGSQTAKSMVLPDTANELVDPGRVDGARLRRIVEKEETIPGGDQRKSRVWAIDMETANPEILSMIRSLDPKSKTVNQVWQKDSFASLIGTEHAGLMGSSLLVEFEPASGFENLVRQFVEEFQANMEPVAVFTSVGSPVHKQMRGVPDVKLFAFSTKTSTPTKGLGEEVLLPERDSSLLLDAIDKLLEASRGQSVGVVLDVFTDLLLLQGFDKAYGVLSSVMEMLDSQTVTTIVMVNLAAHEEKVLNGIRGLFRSRVVSNSNGINLIRFTPHPERGFGKEGFDSLPPHVEGVSGS
jgi:hypothetical protein